MSYEARLKKQYEDEIVSKLTKEFSYTSKMQVPRIEKICLNQGLGKAVADRKMVDTAIEEMTMIAGQRAIACMSTKDVSNFKLRKKMPIGCKVTLRGVKLSGFDGRGNYTFGVKEQIIFPEIDLDQVKHINGMDITLVTTARTDEEAKALLAEFGFPFAKN
jgi:large subunit ribosomal protein L5